MVHFTVLLDGLTEGDIVEVERCLTSAGSQGLGWRRIRSTNSSGKRETGSCTEHSRSSFPALTSGNG